MCVVCDGIHMACNGMRAMYDGIRETCECFVLRVMVCMWRVMMYARRATVCA